MGKEVEVCGEEGLLTALSRTSQLAIFLAFSRQLYRQIPETDPPLYSHTPTHSTSPASAVRIIIKGTATITQNTRAYYIIKFQNISFFHHNHNNAYTHFLYNSLCVRIFNIGACYAPAFFLSSFVNNMKPCKDLVTRVTCQELSCSPIHVRAWTTLHQHFTYLGWLGAFPSQAWCNACRPSPMGHAAYLEVHRNTN